MFERIFAIIRKEFLQVFRDPRMKMVIFISPLIQILIFGYAATMDITHIPTAVYDLDNTKESRDVIRRFSYSKYFQIKYNIYKEEDQQALIDKSKVIAVIKFNRGFGRDLTGDRSAELQLIVDGTDSNAASIILSYAGAIISDYNYNILRERAAIYLKRSDAISLVDLRDRSWFNENLESRNFYLPGVVVLIVSIMSLLLSSMAIVREKEIGTMEQLIVSPLRPIELILGKIIPFGLIAMVQVTVLTTVGALWFGVPVRGSIPLIFISTIVYLLTTLGMGLFISTLCSTQQEAMMSVFLVYFPMTLLSGFAYPILCMPTCIQYATLINPMRYFLVIIRGIFLKGVGIKVLWDEIAILLVIGVTVITLSAKRFRKNLG